MEAPHPATATPPESLWKRLARRALDGGMLLCLAVMIMLLADVTIQTERLSLTSYGNPFRFGLLLAALRAWIFGWPRLTSRGARRALVFALLLFAIPLLQPHADSDGDFCYAYLRSMVIDGDFSLVNEAAWYATGWMRDIATIISDGTGYGYSGHTIGLAVLAAPLYIPVHMAMEWMAAHNLTALADGYTAPEKLAVALATLLGLLTGAVFNYRIARRWSSPFPAALATATAILASPLLCYGYHEGSFAHGLTFGLMAWWFALWLAWRGNLSFPRLARLGLFLGLTCIVRPQCALFLLLPWIDRITFSRRRAGMPDVSEVNAAVSAGALLVGAFLVGFLPQMLVWHFERGSMFSTPQGPDYLDFTRLAHLKVLFHWNHGLFTWHPVHLIGLLGLLMIRGRTRGFALLLLAGFAMQVSINAAAVDWHAGGAFGQRRLETAIPMAALGLAALLEWASKRAAARAAGSVLCVLLVVWNLLLFAQVAEGPIYYTNPIDPGTIWDSQWETGPESLAAVVPQSPAWRMLRLAVDEGGSILLAKLALLAAAGLGLAWITALLTRWLGPRMLRRTRGTPALWLLAPVLIAAPFLLAHANTERMTILVRHEGVLKTRDLRLNARERFQGCGLHEVIQPGEPWWEIMPHPIVTGGVTIVGWLEDADRWVDGQELGWIDFHLDSGEMIRKPLISGKHLLPRNHACLMEDGAALDAHDFARAWVEPTSAAQTRPYLSLTASFAVEAATPITAIGITQNAGTAYHLEGIAFAGTALELPEPSGLSSMERTEPGRAVDFSIVANSDYRFNPFRVHNTDKRWPFYPDLQSGWWRASGRRFLIAPPHAGDGPWPTLTTAYADSAAYEIPLPDGIERLVFLWSAFMTYDKKKPRTAARPACGCRTPLPGRPHPAQSGHRAPRCVGLQRPLQHGAESGADGWLLQG